jgi:hypothetical protein
MHSRERPHSGQRLKMGTSRKHIALLGWRDILEQEHTGIALRVDEPA